MPRVNPARVQRRPAPLAEVDVAAATVAWYATLLRAFDAFLLGMQMPVHEMFLRSDPAGVIIWAARFLQFCYDRQLFGRSEAGGFISGLRRAFRIAAVEGVFFEAGPGFNMLWRLYQGWRRLEPEEFRAPVPREMLYAIAASCWLSGESFATLLLLVGFHALLRLGEMLMLCFHDLVVFDDFERSHGRPPGLVRIRTAKMRGRGLGRQQFVTLRESWLCDWIARVKACLPRSRLADPIWSGTEAQFRTVWRHALAHCQLTHLRLLLGGIRGGGAVFEFLRDENVPRVRRLGRWAREETLERYLQEGVYWTTGLRIEDGHRNLVQRLAGHLPTLIQARAPPPPERLERGS